MPIPDGFISRIEAQEKFDRSKMSFIRDVDQARKRNDSAFLENFIIMLKDDRVVPCETATKNYLRSNDSLKPEWYIRQKLLETRYWSKRGKKTNRKFETGESSKSKGTEPASDKSDLHDGKYVQLLEQSNSELREQNAKQLGMIEQLTENQKQSNVLFKSLTDLLGKEGTVQEELIAASSQSALASIVEPAAKPVVEVPANSPGKVPKASKRKKNQPGKSATKTPTTAPEKNDSIWHKDMFWFLNNRFKK